MKKHCIAYSLLLLIICCSVQLTSIGQSSTRLHAADVQHLIAAYEELNETTMLSNGFPSSYHQLSIATTFTNTPIYLQKHPFHLFMNRQERKQPKMLPKFITNKLCITGYNSIALCFGN